MKQVFPLSWPTGYKRTAAGFRIDSRFKATMGRAQSYLHAEVQRLGGTGLIVSTDLRVRQDGLIYAVDLDKLIEDPGVAIYFTYKKKEVTMCCDQYRRVWENMYALAKGIEALRGMERWGVSEFLERAFTGFAALPENVSQQSWCEVLGVQPWATAEQIREAWRALVKVHHPDAGGTSEMFNKIQMAYEQGMAQLKNER